MATYLLSMVQPTGGEMPPPEVMGPIMAELEKLRTELVDRGSWVFGNGLTPPESATVVRDGLLTDGPFAEGKEYLGGVTIIDVEDLDAALAYAKRYHEVTTLPIEVRPFQG